MSWCSVYGASGDTPSKEGDPTEPLTAYAKCKVLVEQDVAPLADDNFSPTFMRNATAFGASPRQRFDLVVNDLAATAYLDHEIRMVERRHAVAAVRPHPRHRQAVACVLDAPRDVVHNEIFNVGSDERTTRSARSPRSSAELVPGCAAAASATPAPTSATTGPTSRRSTSSCPASSARGTSSAGRQELLDIFARIGFDEELYRFRGHTRIKQIRHLLDTRADRRRLLLDVTSVPKVDVAITTWNRRDTVVRTIASAARAGRRRHARGRVRQRLDRRDTGALP